MRGDFTRRNFLAMGGGLSLAGLLSACGSPVVTSLTGGQPATADVIFWHLFGGGDGENMGTMVDTVQKATGHSVESTLLSWGNPYYTKLALAASSQRPPDVAISHLSRLSTLAQAGLLTPYEETGLAELGVTQDKFSAPAWQKATIDGSTYAIPLDTHPFVLYYNVDLAGKAGLLNDAGDGLTDISGEERFLEALTEMKKVTGKYGVTMANTADPSTAWRWFMTVYGGLVKDQGIVSDSGTKVTVDDEAMQETFAFLQKITVGQKLAPPNATGAVATQQFSGGEAGFLFDGVWQITVYSGVKMPDGSTLNLNMVPFPALLGDEACAYADSHSLVIPRASGRSAERAGYAAQFIQGLLGQSALWAQGGHIPAWLPTVESAAFKELSPQKNYVDAAANAVYDPDGWYTGAGSDFQNTVGAIIISALAGQMTPKSATSQMKSALKKLADTNAPVS
ncbi:extracellular solute-binding protein [Kineosporia sp. J2-2]|uniref:Extracellular solute-binding protein n=1 Tax=Kineosporia corallincola TaxID=2835133 RepID=A0ABS5TTJ1_9ACTN|nr:extracellular solute-binding protein [Kineosporia corallincola]MBT0774080.1 extracellular solute-binding protein [Kineosporia corallincola]